MHSSTEFPIATSLRDATILAASEWSPRPAQLSLMAGTALGQVATSILGSMGAITLEQVVSFPLQEVTAQYLACVSQFSGGGGIRTCDQGPMSPL